jgi:ketosteroid isomerase-like protein
MSQENVEMVRRAYEAYSRGDIDGAVADFAPDCRYTAAGIIPDRTGSFTDPRATRSSSAGCEATSTTPKPGSMS